MGYDIIYDNEIIIFYLYESKSKFELYIYRKDFVYIYDGGNITDTPAQTWTGSVDFGEFYQSSGQDVYIRFTSDSASSVNLGFEIEYEAGKNMIKSM